MQNKVLLHYFTRAHSCVNHVRCRSIILLPVDNTILKKSQRVVKCMSVNSNLQAVQRCADYPGGLWLTGQFKGQHIFVCLDVVGSGRDHCTIPAKIKGSLFSHTMGRKNSTHALLCGQSTIMNSEGKNGCFCGNNTYFCFSSSDLISSVGETWDKGLLKSELWPLQVTARWHHLTLAQFFSFANDTFALFDSPIKQSPLQSTVSYSL